MNIIKYLTNWKYRYFRKKLRGVQFMIADLEFKRAKTRMIREEIRQEYDNQKSKLMVLETQIESEESKPDEFKMEKGEFARLGDQKVLLENDIEKFTQQMKGLDLEIAGSKPTAEFHDGVQGINDRLDALRELVGMLHDYIKSL